VSRGNSTSQEKLITKKKAEGQKIARWGTEPAGGNFNKLQKRRRDLQKDIPATQKGGRKGRKSGTGVVS